MFDPEKVERYSRHCQSAPTSERMTWTEDYVLASDYDQLLELYLAATKPLVDGKDFCVTGGESIMDRSSARKVQLSLCGGVDGHAEPCGPVPV